MLNHVKNEIPLMKWKLDKNWQRPNWDESSWTTWKTMKNNQEKSTKMMTSFLADPVIGKNLRNISKAMLEYKFEKSRSEKSNSHVRSYMWVNIIDTRVLCSFAHKFQHHQHRIMDYWFVVSKYHVRSVNQIWEERKWRVSFWIFFANCCKLVRQMLLDLSEL